MKQTPFVDEGARSAYLNFIKDNVDEVHLVKDFLATDSLATITGSKSVASASMAPADMAVTDDGDIKKLTFNAKSGLTKNNSSEQYFNGTASSGTTSSLTVSGENFPDYARKVVHITSGTGQGESAKISSNTATVLTFDADAFSVALDATSEFVILDDLSIAYVNSTGIRYVCEETTDKAIDAASSDQVNIGATELRLPKITEVAS